MEKLNYKNTHFIKSATTTTQRPPGINKEIAFIGRSNSGKSSVINVLTNQRNLAKTSKTPGRTQLINYFAISDTCFLVDLPGYGYAKVASRVKKSWDTMLDEYFRANQSLMAVVMIVDIRRLLTEFDMQMLDYAKAYNIPVHILLNKTDKLTRNYVNQAKFKVRNQIKNYNASIGLFSALKKQGVDELEHALDNFFTAPA